MIFAAKENNEVSYTKNESANAMTEYVQESLSETILAELYSFNAMLRISIFVLYIGHITPCSLSWYTCCRYHANAVWTQLILVTCTWSIAFLSLKFESIVFKWVFFIFNFAQVSYDSIQVTTDSTETGTFSEKPKLSKLLRGLEPVPVSCNKKRPMVFLTRL